MVTSEFADLSCFWENGKQHNLWERPRLQRTTTTALTANVLRFAWNPYVAVISIGANFDLDTSVLTQAEFVYVQNMCSNELPAYNNLVGFSCCYPPQMLVVDLDGGKFLSCYGDEEQIIPQKLMKALVTSLKDDSGWLTFISVFFSLRSNLSQSFHSNLHFLSVMWWRCRSNALQYSSSILS